MVNAGNTAELTPAKRMPMPSRFSSDTSGATFRLMRPPSSTVGVKCTEIPNSFSTSVIRFVPLALSWATGMKILPPARKLPSWPLIAITFGSARILITPSRFSASRARSTLPLFLVSPNTPALPVRKFEINWYVKVPPERMAL